jgi:4-oxalocrotonate tautomerase
MLDITQALVKNLGVDVEVVTVQINEAPLTHKMKGSKTFLERKAAANNPPASGVRDRWNG